MPNCLMCDGNAILSWINCLSQNGPLELFCDDYHRHTFDWNSDNLAKIQSYPTNI